MTERLTVNSCREHIQGSRHKGNRTIVLAKLAVIMLMSIPMSET